MTIQLIAGSRDLTAAYSDLTFSNVDPGGFETLQATTTNTDGIEIGDEVIVRSGMDVAWHGRVNELGPRERGQRATTQLAAVGYAAKLSDKRLSMIYADSDLAGWGNATYSYKLSLIPSGYNTQDPTVNPDGTGGIHTVQLSWEGAWGATVLPNCTARYDAGEGNKIGAIYLYWGMGGSVTAIAPFVHRLYVADVDDNSAGTAIGDNSNLPSTGQYLAASPARRYSHMEFRYTAGSSGTQGFRYIVNVQNPVIYGDHGLTRRGTAPGGFYPADIAGHALTDSAAGFTLVAGDSSTLTVRHAVYRTPVSHQQIIDEQAKLMGWHWGVWEPASILDGTPRMFFGAPPAAPTCIISRDQISDLDAPRVRVDRLYDTAKIAWQDPGSSRGVQTVTIANPLTAAAGVSGRTLDLDMGRGDSTTATAYGTFALNLALASARGGGSGTVPADIASTSGGRQPACLLRSGRDRIRITDLPDSGSWTETDANRQDSFLVRRVETTVRNGQPSTHIEFDGGADLLDVLNARLALAAVTGSAV